MNGKIVWPCTIGVLVGVTVLSMPLFAAPPGKASGLSLDDNEREVTQGLQTSLVGNGGRLSPASLDLDTCGCPTTFDPPVCEEQTSWTIDKTTADQRRDEAAELETPSQRHVPFGIGAQDVLGLGRPFSTETQGCDDPGANDDHPVLQPSSSKSSSVSLS